MLVSYGFIKIERFKAFFADMQQVFLACALQQGDGILRQGKLEQLVKLRVNAVAHRGRHAHAQQDGLFTVFFEAVPTQQNAAFRQKMHFFVLVAFAALTTDEIGHIAADCQHTQLDRRLDKPRGALAA